MNNNNKFIEYIVGIIYVIFVIGFFAFLLGFPVKWLWNDVMPDLFGLTKITYWKAVEMNLLCGFLFRGTTTIKQ